MSRFAAMSSCAVRKTIGIGLLLATSLTAVADSTSTPSAPGRVPQPVIEAARGGQCVEDPAFMRRNHMKLLKHQRDDTLRGGIRTGNNSLKACIACHASQTSSSVNAASTNFCQSCHNYAAVKIDCFECHASKPPATSFHPLVSHGTKSGDVLSLQLRQLVAQQKVGP